MDRNQVGTGFAGSAKMTGCNITFGQSSEMKGTARVIGGSIEVAKGQELKTKGVTIQSTVITGTVTNEDAQ